MPFKSRAQQAYLAINKPSVAKKYAAHSKGKAKGLPTRVKSSKAGKGRSK